jgi:hypothetical protein
MELFKMAASGMEGTLMKNESTIEIRRSDPRIAQR